MSLTIDSRKFLFISDLIAEEINTLSFKLPSANVTVQIIILYKVAGKEKYKIINKTSNSSGIVVIQAKQAGATLADVPANLFNQHQGYFYFKFYISSVPLSIQNNFQGVVFEFKNIDGASSNNTIDLSGGTIITPEEPILFGLNFATLGTSFILV